MSLLNTAYSGLSAFQQALNVTANNITNFGTKGYSRQSINFSPNSSVKYAGSFVGSGVNVKGIQRNVDQFAKLQVRGTQSMRSEHDSFYQQASQIDKLLSQDGANISSSLQLFFNALNQLNNTPDSATARNVVLTQSQLLVNQFNYIQTELDNNDANTSIQISQTANQVNQITQQLATLNGQIQSNASEPSLLDQQELLLQELSQYLNITSVPQGDGSINVSLASGESLVSGTMQANLQVNTTEAGTQIYLASNAVKVDVTAKINSGTIGGLLNYQENILGQVSRQLGLIAIGLAKVFNAQHRMGMDMNNKIGQNFFTDFNSSDMVASRVSNSTSNNGNAHLSVSIDDISQTRACDYSLKVTDTATQSFQLIRKSDGAVTTGTWQTNGQAPNGAQFVADGLTISVDDVSQLALGDSFVIKPTKGAANSMSLKVDDIRQLALASPIRTSALDTNTGSGSIALGTLFNTTDVQHCYTIAIDPNDPTQYTVITSGNGLPTSSSAGPYTLPANGIINLPPDSVDPSYSITLSGTPSAGDKFIADYNTGGIADNRNGATLSTLNISKLFADSTASLGDLNTNMISGVGNLTNRARLQFSAADVLHQQANDFQESQSGVNMDEEAANLLKYKQAYEASGKLVQVANEIMNVILDMMR